jgi:hypothetical protein
MSMVMRYSLVTTGILHLLALVSQFVGIVRLQGIMPKSARMKLSASFAAGLATWPRIALPRKVTLGFATIATNQVILQRIARMRRHATIAINQVILQETALVVQCAMFAIKQVILHVNVVVLVAVVV